MSVSTGRRAEIVDDAGGDAQAILSSDRYRRIEEIGAQIIDAESQTPPARKRVFETAANRPSRIMNVTRNESAIGAWNRSGRSRAAHKEMKMRIQRVRT